MSKFAVVRCPVCGKSTSWQQEPIGTFCSKRCQMIDLSHWLNGVYHIGQRPVLTHKDAMQELEKAQEN